jgi:hypothetical protein
MSTAVRRSCLVYIKKKNTGEEKLSDIVILNKGNFFRGKKKQARGHICSGTHSAEEYFWGT